MTGDEKLKSADKAHYFIKIVFFLLVAALIYVVLFPVQRKINEYIILQKKQVIELLEKKINYQISYNDISPSLVHAFEIRGLKISSFNEPEDYIIEIEKIRLSFNIFKISKENPLNAFTGLNIVNSEFRFNSEKIHQLSKMIDNIDSNTDEISSGPGLPELFTIKGKNISMKVELSDFNLHLSDLFFTVSSTKENDLKISAKTGLIFQLSGLAAPLPVSELSINTIMKFTGRLSPDFSWADIDINSKSFNSNIFSADKIKWNLKYDTPGKIIVTKTGDSIPIDLRLDADTSSGSLSAEFKSKDFIFTDYFSESAPFEKYHQLLSSLISGEARVEFKTDTEDFIYDADLSIKNINGLSEYPFDIEVDLSGANTELYISNSYIRSRIVAAGYSGSLVLSDDLPSLNGILSLDHFEFSGFPVKSILNINTNNRGDYRIHADSASIGELEFEDVSSDILPYGKSLDFKLSAAVMSEKERNYFNSEGNIQIGQDFFIQAALETDKLPVAPFAKLLPKTMNVPQISDDIQLTCSLFLSGNNTELAFASPQVVLEDHSAENKSLSFSLSGNNSGFRINDIRLKWIENSLTGRISTILTEENDIILDSQLIYNNINFEFSGVRDTEGNISVSGDYGIRFNLINNFGNGYNLRLVTEHFPFLLDEELPSYLDLDMMGIYNSHDDWSILANRVNISELPVSDNNGTVSMSALVNQNGGHIFNVSYNDSFSTINGQGSLTYSSDFDEGQLNLALSDSESVEKYNFFMLLQDGKLDGDVVFSRLPVSRFSTDSPIEGYISGNLSIDGTTDSPEAVIKINSTGMKLNNSPFDFNAELEYNELSLFVDEISGKFGKLEFKKLTGELDFKEGIHSIAGAIKLESKFQNIDASFDSHVKTVGISKIKNFSTISAEDFTANFNFSEIHMNGDIRDPWELLLDKEDGLLSLRGGPEFSLSGTFYEDGFFSIEAKDPFPVSFRTSGTLDSGIINADITNINFIFDNLKVPYFYFYEGQLTGNLRIRGNVNDPDFYGQINLVNMVFKPPIVQDNTRRFSTSLFFREKSLKMPSTRIPTDNGMVVLNIDSVMERWLPRYYDINLKIPEDQSVSARYYYPPFYVFGFAMGNMRLFGDFTTMEIDGDLKISNSRMILNNNLDIEVLGKPVEYLKTDLRITTGENNQIFWPTQEVPIVNGFLNTDNSFTISFDSGFYGFDIEGELSLKGGEIFYFEKNFYIKEGKIIFSENAEGKIDPLFSTRAEIRDINSSGDLTKIYLIVDQSPLSKFAPRFESEPALSTVEIISLLGGNFVDSISDSGAFGLSDAVWTSVDIFTQFWLLKGIEDSLKSTLGLDLLSIRSSFLTNIIEDKYLSFSGNNNLSNFAKYLDNTALFLGKYFTDDIFIQGLFQFDLYNNSGYSEGLNIDSEIKLEWEGPVANIELSLFPDLLNPVEGLNRTSVGLSWRFSY